MFYSEEIATLIKQRMQFIKLQQENDGNFIGLSFANSVDFMGANRYHSTFLTSLILDCLCGMSETPDIKQIKERAALFLLNQKSTHWSFNYWMRGSKEAREMPYPDDLDDTFCALAALYHYDKTLINGQVMAHVVTLLTSCEVREGGPYRTWLVNASASDKWQDVDVAVNSNVAYFLSLHDIHLPQLDTFIELAIKKKKLRSSYYPSFYPIIYFISRFYKGELVGKLKELLLLQIDDNQAWENPLHTALSVSALLNLGTEPSLVSGAISYLIQSQKENLWQPYAFCIDPTRERKIFYAGSSALTTAFCLEALEKYIHAIKQSEQSLVEQKSEKEEIYTQIVKKTEDVFSVFESSFREKALFLTNKLFSQDINRHISLLPYYSSLSIGKKKKELSNELLVKLGVANVFGWLAYTIYDDLLDQEKDPSALPIANVSLRVLTSMYESILPENIEFRMLFHTVMDRLDEANAWEVNYCRIKIEDGKIDGKRLHIPDFGTNEQIADKSLGHGLGPLAMLFFLGYSLESQETKQLLEFFKHYLIAKQLNDDAHDWQKDLRMGHITPVTALLLKKLYPDNMKKRKTISLNSALPRMQKIFWKEVIDEVCMTIIAHVNVAKIALKKCKIITDTTLFENIVIIYEQSAQKALNEKKQAMAFLRLYK